MTVKAIIPCAGYGTRMNMEPWKSKEMLDDPVTGKCLIDYSLDLCYKYNIRPVLIVRSEKEDLLKYLLTSKDYGKYDIVICQPGKEWAETVLKSRGLWGDQNILLLPDTRFSSDEVIPKIIHDLTWNHHSEVVAAVHEIDPEDSDKWGTIDLSCIHEKCKVNSNAAWGILGWSGPYAGYDLFSSLKPGKSYYNQGDMIIYHKLDWFKDITRTGKLEKY